MSQSARRICLTKNCLQSLHLQSLQNVGSLRWLDAYPNGSSEGKLSRRNELNRQQQDRRRHSADKQKWARMRADHMSLGSAGPRMQTLIDVLGDAARPVLPLGNALDGRGGDAQLASASDCSARSLIGYHAHRISAALRKQGAIHSPQDGAIASARCGTTNVAIPLTSS